MHPVLMTATESVAVDPVIPLLTRAEEVYFSSGPTSITSAEIGKKAIPSHEQYCKHSRAMGSDLQGIVVASSNQPHSELILSSRGTHSYEGLFTRLRSVLEKENAVKLWLIHEIKTNSDGVYPALLGGRRDLS